MTTPGSPHVDVPHDTGPVEIADRVWLVRHSLLDVNVTVVGGQRGLLVVDTHSSAGTARPLVEQVRALGAGEVVAVVNTHAHFDHCLGNATFLEAYDGVPVVAHEQTVATLAERGEHLLREAEQHVDVTDTVVVVPDTPFSSATVIDLGDRQVEVLHPGRGHTAGDAVARVGDVDLLLVGDLVEESVLRGAVPAFGDDCYPLEWTATLDLLIGLLSPKTVVVPGHGLPVDKDFVMEQRGSIGMVAETIRDLAARGVRPADMAQAASWPYPVEELGHAFTRGFAQLPRPGRGLPLA